MSIACKLVSYKCTGYAHADAALIIMIIKIIF